MEEGNIILTPYVDNGEPVIIVSVVTKGYHFDPEYTDIHSAHQIGIKFKANIPRKHFKKISQQFYDSLNSRLTLSKLDFEDHQKAIEYIVKEMEKPGHRLPNQLSVKKLNSEYKISIEALITSFNETQDELTKKSLLFSMLCLNEAYLKDRIIEALVTKEVRVNDVLLEVVSKNVIEFLYSAKTRTKIAKKYFINHNLGKAYYKLRNALAHDFRTVRFDDSFNQVEYQSKENANTEIFEDPISIVDLFTALGSYVKKLDKNKCIKYFELRPLNTF